MSPKPASQVTTQTEYLSPGDAKALLEMNLNNRHVYDKHVTTLRGHMLAGRWKFNGDTIRLSPTGEVLDGQHRLHALAGIDDQAFRLPFLVVYGIERDTQSTMDQNRTRSAADQLVLDDHIAHLNSRDATMVAGAIRVFQQWTGGKLFGDHTRTVNKISNIEVVEIGANNPNMVSSLAELICTDLRRVKCRPSLTLAIMYRFCLIDQESAGEFMSLLYSGANMTLGHPILTLRERLDRIRDQRTTTSDKDMIAFFVLAWNAFRDERQLSKFQRPNGGTWSRDNYPEPR